MLNFITNFGKFQANSYWIETKKVYYDKESRLLSKLISKLIVETNTSQFVVKTITTYFNLNGSINYTITDLGEKVNGLSNKIMKNIYDKCLKEEKSKDKSNIIDLRKSLEHKNDLIYLHIL